MFSVWRRLPGLPRASGAAQSFSPRGGAAGTKLTGNGPGGTPVLTAWDLALFYASASRRLCAAVPRGPGAGALSS